MPRSLAEFIRENGDAILAEWDTYARNLNLRLTGKGLRDDAARLLGFIADDIELKQTPHEQREKSQGRGTTETPGDGIGAPKDSDPSGNVDTVDAAADHAAHRYRQGFDINQMISEYRALRASVTRLWLAAERPPATLMQDQLVRFNEAIDQLVAESVAQFSLEMDTGRQLFLGTLGHDLRSPLSAIHATMSAWKRDPGARASDKVSADRVLRSAERMREMISDLLDFTRTQLGSRLPIERDHCDLRSVIETAVDEARSANPVAIEMSFTGDVVGMWDCSRMGQLASNLISNAVTHGSRETPIKVSLRGQADTVQLQVQNAGSRISVARQRTIFQPLVRHSEETEGASSGLGLGLYICKQIVVAHGGSISFQSSPADGTEVRVELPRDGTPA